jgi:hypothetical protein
MGQIQLIRGDSKVLTVSVTRNNAPYDLTGHTLRFTAKYRYSDPDSQAVFQLTSAPGGGITVTNATGGQARIEIEPVHTASLPPVRTRLVYDLQLTDGGGGVYTVDIGELVVAPDVTITT